MRTPNRRVVTGVALAAIGLTAAGFTIAGAQSDDTTRGTDPLSAAELEVAAAQARGSGSGPTEAGGLGDDDVVLLVERHEEAKDADPAVRRADVWVYSYDDDVLNRTVVDLTTGVAERTEVVPNTQLPLVAEEGERAVEIALADPELEQQLATAYRQGTGRDLTDFTTEVIVDPIVFRADAANGATGDAALCGRHRCAQLLLRSSDDFLINLLPIIDLSSGQVVSRTGFFS